MPSEHRLHPASLLFALWGSVKTLALPAALFIFSSLGGSNGSSGGDPGGWSQRWVGFQGMEGWQAWALLFAALAMMNAVFHYLTFRITYEGSELVIRSGFFFRNERHVPYDRIQNLDATRHLVHRLFSVAEVRVETGGGTEPEARISVLHESAFEEMRRRVFAGRSAPPAEDESAGERVAPAPATASTLLHLPTRELILLGAMENRGMLALAAVYGVFWELGWQNLLWNRLTGSTYAFGALSDLWTRLSAGQFPRLWELGLMAAGLFVLVVLVRLVSMVWVAVTLHDFRLTRVGDDLRTEYGLLTRVTATIPRRRIQTVIIRATPLQRWLGRTSVRVETAGASAAPQDGRSFQRERLAPIISESALGDLLRIVMPACDPDQLAWQPVHPRAFRRAVKPMLLVSGVPSVFMLLVNWRLWPLMLLALAATVLITWKQVQQFAWAVGPETVATKSGWLWRRISIAPLVRIQAVSTTESPFDRRAGMASVAVDTAGSQMVYRVRIPYLARDVANDLSKRLSAAAARTAFRW